MKGKILVLLVLFLGVEGKLQAQSIQEKACIQSIRDNYIRSLVKIDSEKSRYLELLAQIPGETEVSDQNIVELYQRYPIAKEEAEELVNTLSKEGYWPDINYSDKKRSGWEPKKHAERILKLTKYFYNQPAIEKEELKAAIHRAMKFWFNRDFSCLNWWYNQIGVPRTLGPAFMLFESEMSPKEKELAIREMQYSKFGMTGQNKVWLAGNVLIRGLLQNDYKLIKAARDTIVSEIVLGKPEGIKSDWSFHQHGAQQQFGNYGLSFLGNLCTYVELLAQTPLALSSGQVDILFSFFREGYQWIVWKGYWDVNALNRQLFHNADIHKSYTLLFAVDALMKGATSKQEREIRQFIRNNFLRPEIRNEWVGNKVFWDSDMTVHRTPTWMASVKMASERVIGTELVNEDNKQGYYLADGAMYTYVAGDEYHNVFPFWDWRKIPGITCIETEAPIPTRYGTTSRNHSRFVGGVTDGQNGITAMVLNRNGVEAQKSWIFTEHFVLCLGSGIQAGDSPVTTSIEQTIGTDELKKAGTDGKWYTVESGNQTTDEISRFYHRNTGYIVLQADTCCATVGKRSGQWFDIMGMYKPQIIQEKVASIYMKHSLGNISTYQYLVLPASTPQEVVQFDPACFSVLYNTDKVQVVAFDQKYYVAAYQACRVDLTREDQLEIKTPGLFLIHKNKKKMKIYVADPTQKQSSLHIVLNQKPVDFQLNAHGFAERNL